MPPESDAEYKKMSALLAELKEHTKYETRLSLLEQDLENYVKETDIHKMISAKLAKYDEEQTKLDAKGINWTAILQAVIAAVIVSSVTAYIASRGQ